MPSRQKKPQRGRPAGSRSFDAESAQAFGIVIKSVRLASDVSQEGLAYAADVERSYLGRIERGQSQPTLFLILKLAHALGVDGAILLSQVEYTLARRRRAAKAAARSTA